MSREIFIDTSGFYAILVQADQQHASAKAILDSAAKKRARFLTTDYVLDETATLLKARGFAHLANPFFNLIQSSDACRVLWTDQERFSVVQRFFIKHLELKLYKYLK